MASGEKVKLCVVDIDLLRDVQWLFANELLQKISATRYVGGASDSALKQKDEFLMCVL